MYVKIKDPSNEDTQGGYEGYFLVLLPQEFSEFSTRKSASGIILFFVTGTDLRWE